MYYLEFAGEDDAFAAREAACAATGVDRVAPGLAVAGHVDREAVRRLAYTRRANRLVGRTDASVGSARALLRAATLDRSGTVAVRARDVRGTTGVSTAAAERELGAVLVDRGFAVDLEDPDHVLRVCFAGNGAAGGTDGAGPGDGTGPADGERREGPQDRRDPNAGGRADAASPGPRQGATGGPDGEDGPTGVAADDVCLVGWRAAESVRDYGDRRPTDRPFFQPGSMAPLDARAVANIAGAAPGRTVLDPMCGTGGVLLEAGLVGARPVGVDAQAKMVRGTRRNLREYLGDAGADRWADPGAVCQGDATRLPLVDDAVDAVVFDAPYGRQSHVASHDLGALVAGALAEAHRVAPRCVLVADRSWRVAAVDAGWRVTDRFARRVHGSLTRYVHVLERD